MRDSFEKPAPTSAGPTDEEKVMAVLGPDSALEGGADDPRVVELLAHWDDLPAEALARIEEHPDLAPRLRLLRRVERYLGADPCPSAEELYDFAKGPGYRPLQAEDRRRIARHLAHCSDCESLTLCLEDSPPLPLVLAPQTPPREARGAQLPSSTPNQATPRFPHSVERWLPLAAAAAVLAIGSLAFRSRIADAGSPWPVPSRVRGEERAALGFPRDQVLAAGTVPGGGWSEAPRFELAPIPGADSYRVVVRRGNGGAFADGSPILTLSGKKAILPAQEALEPGHYTWEAWASVDGLEQLIGERDFEVVEVHGLKKRLAYLADIDRVKELHTSGHLTDARALAQRLPPSPGRDAYLEAWPKR